MQWGTPAFARADTGRVVSGFPGEQRLQHTKRWTGQSRARPAEENAENEIGVAECVRTAAGRPEHSAEVRMGAICSSLRASLNSVGANEAGNHAQHARRFHAV